MHRYGPILLAASVVAAGCAGTSVSTSGVQPAAAPGGLDAGSAATARENPFLAPSTLPYQAPRFDLIQDGDFRPALEEGIRRERAEIEEIAAQTAEPTFENTIEALERSGELLERVSSVFYALTSANTNDTLQAVQKDVAPKMAELSDALYLNDPLFQRVRTLYERRDRLGLDAEQRTLVERYHRDFVRAGAELAGADKARLRELNQEAARLSTEFGERLLRATRESALVVDDPALLAGLSDAEIAAAAEAARGRGLEGRWVLPLQNTTQQPAQASLTNRETRERLFRASTGRAERGDSADTRELVRRLAQLRAERAKLLGFPDFASYRLADQMAKTPAAAVKLLTDLVPAASARARSEAARMQQLVDRQGGGFQLAPWDWQHYAEQLRRAEYDLDESQLKPYFEMNSVLENGVFYAANQLYGITFRERKDIPVYHPDVRVFEVFDADGSPLALFYADYFKRDNKRGGAWMSNFVDQSGLMGTKPVVYNVANFPKPAPGQPALLTHDEVETMFHEFGHALHGIFSDVRYPTLSGTSVPRDFVEFPSQFNEHWALEPRVLAHYARHYQTGAPMPQALAEKIRRAGTFNQGFATMEYLEAALLDMAWHSLPADAPQQDVDAFEAAALARYHVAMPQIPPRYRTTYFAHVWSGGYAAAYYAYLWAEVLDHDAYYWFREHGGLTRENGQRFRDLVLSRGSTQDVATLFRDFRGRDPIVQPLLEQRGLTTEEAEK